MISRDGARSLLAHHGHLQGRVDVGVQMQCDLVLTGQPERTLREPHLGFRYLDAGVGAGRRDVDRPHPTQQTTKLTDPKLDGCLL